jgi:CRP-like cAMP-binding protein
MTVAIDRVARPMILVTELAAAPVLSKADPDVLALVAQAAADIRLAVGEYAAHEGDERALYVVLSGFIQVTKRFEGIERVIGKRLPGQVFGEIPIIFGIAFQGNFRATEPTRVARIEAAQFHALAGASPEMLTEVAALARDRMGGLQGFAATPAQTRATLIGHAGDEACRTLRTFLTRNQIKFDWLKADAPDAAARWPGAPVGAGDLPALHCDDGSTLMRAQNREGGAVERGPRSLPAGDEGTGHLRVRRRARQRGQARRGGGGRGEHGDRVRASVPGDRAGSASPRGGVTGKVPRHEQAQGSPHRRPGGSPQPPSRLPERVQLAREQGQARRQAGPRRRREARRRAEAGRRARAEADAGLSGPSASARKARPHPDPLPHERERSQGSPSPRPSPASGRGRSDQVPSPREAGRGLG